MNVVLSVTYLIILNCWKARGNMTESEAYEQIN